MAKKLAVPAAVLAAVVGVAGMALTTSNEGKVNKTYLDPVGIVTACYGHTGPELRLGQTFTDAQCSAYLHNDMAAAQVPLRGPFNCINSIPLSQNQLDALTDFVFNVGTPKFCKSTMTIKLRVKDYRGAGAEFPKWVYGTVNGKSVKLPGLIKRRTEETCVFEAPSGRALSCLPSGALRGIVATSR